MIYLLVFKFIGPFIDKFSQSAYRHFTRFWLTKAGIAFSGLPLWVSPQTYFDRGDGKQIVLGDRCVISHGVRILTHDYSLDRYFERLNGKSNIEVVKIAPVYISDQSFVGMGSLIMPGVTIGEGAIVGAGSVVTRSVDPDTVVAGVPARRVALTSEVWSKHVNTVTKKNRRP